MPSWPAHSEDPAKVEGGKKLEAAITELLARSARAWVGRSDSRLRPVSAISNAEGVIIDPRKGDGYAATSQKQNRNREARCRHRAQP